MRTEHLEYLVEVSKTKSMSLAGKHLYVSHQGISSAIAMLENELGVSLLNRTKNGVSLTETGEKYVCWATNFLEELKELKSKTPVLTPVETLDLAGTLTIYTAPFFYNIILPKVITVYKEKYPKVKICIKSMDSYDVLTSIAAEKADFGLVVLVKNYINIILADLKIKDSVKIEKLFFDQLYVLAGKSSPIALKKSLSIEEILENPLAIYYGFKSIVPYLESYSFLYRKPNVFIESSSKETNLSTIAAGLAIGLTAKRITLNNDYLNNILAIPIRDKIELFVGWTKPSSCELSPFSQAFLSILKTVL